MKKIIVAIMIGLVGLVGAVACSTGDQTNASVPNHVRSNTWNQVPSPAKHGSPAADGTAAHPLPWNHTLLGGLDITVDQPMPFTTSETASSGGGKNAVALTVTVVNHTDQAINSGTDVAFLASADNASADQVVDNGMGDTMSPILPGHTLTWKVAFLRPDNATTLNVDAQTLIDPMNVTDTYWSGPIGS